MNVRKWNRRFVLNWIRNDKDESEKPTLNWIIILRTARSEPQPQPQPNAIVMFYTTYLCTQHTLGSHLHSRVHKHLLMYSFVLFIWVGNFVSFRFCSKTTTSQRRLHCENQSPYFPIQIFHRNLNVSDSVALLRTLQFNEWIQRNISSFRLVRDLKCGFIVWLVPTWPLRLAGSAEQWQLKQKINS